jgi:hypothetical protein
MKSLAFFIFVYIFISPVLAQQNLPNESGDRIFTQIDTLYYLPDTTKFATNYAIANEIFYPHCRFKPNNNSDYYKIREIHFLFSHMVIGDTLKTIALFKDTLKTKIYEQIINDILDSVDVYPNWYKVIIDTNFAPVQGVIEVPYWLIGVTDLALPTNTIPSGNSIGFYGMGQKWDIIPDYPVKLIIEQNTTEVPSEIQKPELFILYQNYPNPFNPSTTIRFSLPMREYVTLKIFDILGREVATLVDEELNAGDYSLVFNANKLQNGIYFYQLTTKAFSQTKMMLMIK